MSELTLLWRLWLAKPRQIATLAPSGAAVAAAFVDAVAAAPDEGTIVELGAGTGPVTSAMLAAGVDRQRLCIVEANAELAAHLRRRFGRDLVARADARALDPLFETRRIDRIAAVISTLPILHFGRTGQRAVLDDCFARAAPGATFTQITYLPGSPVRQRHLRAWNYCAERYRRVAQNWPPATLWQYRARETRPSGDRYRDVCLGRLDSE
ncbi:class I SAM-dependent methyltransferase [Salinisphaera sp. LB1]|uniref:class I SAM-dependent methyltransferase n=1 Tax=Salinisphaera sp. LB1 TaxID=2183911 RepID=UPI000D7085A7|nr:hypothetical protein [Salinisphaera sp. LB1]AWN14788.1 Phospholipid N-methyltransferase [Salinisphaera sp. LB1]